MYVKSLAWGKAHGKCSINASHFWWWCCCWSNIVGALWSTRVHGLGHQLSLFIQGGGISQHMGPTVLEVGVYQANQDELLTLMSTQGSVQSDLIAFAVQIPASCIYNSHFVAKKMI